MHPAFLVIIASILKSWPLAAASRSHLQAAGNLSLPVPIRVPPPLRFDNLIDAWPQLPVGLHISNDVQVTIDEYGLLSSSRRQDVNTAAEALEAMAHDIYDRRMLAQNERLDLGCETVFFRLNLFGKPWPSIMKDIARLVHLLALFTRTCGEAISIAEADVENAEVVVAEFTVDLRLSIGDEMSRQ